MASKKKDEESIVPGMKKRGKKSVVPVKESSDAPKKEEDVVRAPKAPTTAPTRPSGRQRAVDPNQEARKEGAAKGDTAVEAAKVEEARRTEQAAAETKAATQFDAVGMSFDAFDATTDDFAALFEGSGGISKRRRFEVGDTVEGTVVSVGERYLFVDLGDGNEGVADRAQYLDADGQVELSAGQSHDFYVIGFKDGIQLGKEMGGDRGGLDAIEAAFETKIPISGKVTGTNKGGFEVNIMGVNAFCPISQIELGFTEDPEVHVGQTYSFEVAEVREGGRTVVVSRTRLLEKQQAEIRAETMKSLEVGRILTGIVTRVADFGAFVDIGGVEGLVHVSEISHVYFDKPSEVVKEGQEVEVEVLSLEEDARKGLRIGLSMKAAEEDPWLKVNDEFAIGQKTRGTVVRTTSFGAFVEITPGVEGLVHVSEMSWKKHVATASDVVSVGEEIDVEIQDIDLMRRRISLSMKAVEGDPWEQVATEYPLGSEVTGFVENIEDFGAFIRLGEGITALLPRSEMNLPSETTPHRKYSSGQEVTARVLNVEPSRRRMALTLKDATDIEVSNEDRKRAAAPVDEVPRVYKDEEISSKGTFGTLGDLLKSRNKK